MTIKRLTIPRAEMEAAFAKQGLKRAGPDHPVYKEGPSIVFVSMPRARGTKAIVTPASEGDSDE